MSDAHEQLSLDAADAAEEATAGTPPEPGTPTRAQVAPPTAEQAAAIEARDRDVFLEAGAGTGKTRVLVERYCEAVDRDGVGPEGILAFTFTEKAAGEMRRRVRVELGARADAATDEDRRARLREASRAGEAAAITTIHGFCRRLLAAHPVAAGLDPRFRVLDAQEASRIARAAFDEALSALAGSDDSVALTAAGYRAGLGSLVIAAHHDLRNHGRLRAELPDLEIAALESGEPPTPAERAALERGYEALRSLVGEFSSRYDAHKAERSAVDFDDLQLLALDLLRRNEAIAEAQRSRFAHVLVDEFQDTSPIQVELIRALAGPETRTFTVGDEAQSIYAFRGADLDGFRRERERLTRGQGRPTAMLGLSGSFRSTPDVVATVNVIGATLLEGFRPLAVGRAPDPGHQDGEPRIEVLLTNAKGWGEEDEGTKIETAASSTAQNRIAEARGLALRLRELVDTDGVDPGSIVVLLRAFTHVDAFAEALDLAGLDPYIVGGRGYWSSQQVTDGLALLSCVANPLDDEPLLGALASPAGAISPDGLWILRRIAGGRHLWRGIEDLIRESEGEERSEPEEVDEERAALRAEQRRWEERMPELDRERLGRFHATLTELRSTAPLLPLDDLVEHVLEAFGYDLAALSMDDGLRRTANLLKLARLAGEYEAHEGRDLRGFLEQAGERAALSDREAEAAVAAEDHAGVRVMTVHAAKGLEFDCVAVADLGRPLAAGGAPPSLRLAFDEDASAPRVGLRLARAGGPSLDVSGYRQINDEAADADAEEGGRLAYVAASRARRRLILSGTFNPDKDLEPSEEPLRKRSAIGWLLPALGVAGEDGQVVRVDAPGALEGIDAAGFGPARIRISVATAGAEQARRLSADRRAARAAADPAPGTPPMLALAERGTAAARTLSYAALAAYKRCGYRFLAERALQLGRESEATVSGPDGPLPPRPAGTGGSLGFGRAVHELLEWSARNGWPEPPGALVSATTRREGLDAAASEHAAAMVEAWLGSELLGELRAKGARFRPEVPFRIALAGGTVIRGTIDLLVERDGREPMFVDYKTDRVEAGPPVLRPDYELQRHLYAAAVAAATGSASTTAVYCYLQAPGDPIVATLDRAAIDAGLGAVERVVGSIRAGDFAPTADPGPALCHDCPARERLCPYPREITLGTKGEPEPEAA